MSWKRPLACRYCRLEAWLAERRLPNPSDPTGFRASLAGRGLKIPWPQRYAYPPVYVWVDQIRDGLAKIAPRCAIWTSRQDDRGTGST